MKKRLVILTGAGMSAESGLATFRDADGLWANYQIDEVATPEGWYRNPSLVLEFYNKRRSELLRCEPNRGHLGVVALESEFEVDVITQNVDNLHERAGSTRVLHLHGELMKVCSERDTSRAYTLSPDKIEVKLGDKAPDGAQLRPYIVWFGEAVPQIEPAIEIAQRADIFVVIGTSLKVYPAAGLLEYVRPHVPVFLTDPNEVTVSSRRPIRHIRKGASAGVEELIGLLADLL